MSSTYKTSALQLHSWIASDPVLRDDFNYNFNKIDTVVGQLSSGKGNCEIYTGSYTGTNATSFTLSFSKRPALIAIQNNGSLACNFTIVVNSGAYIPMSSRSSYITVSGNTLTVTSSEHAHNTMGTTYHYVVFAV